MIPAAFEYARPATLQEALDLLARAGEDAKVLAGGHSLVPAMKLRLMQPKLLVDIGGLQDLRYIREADDYLAIGALSTHYDVESSTLLKARCPLLPETAPHIGDVQVRNRGTIGGSLVHADPAADWQAAILALNAELTLVSTSSRRRVRAVDFFIDMLETAIEPGEILCEIRVPSTERSVAYVKTAHPASGFAVVGVAVILDVHRRACAVGVTGVAPRPYRATAVEAALGGAPLTVEAIGAASAHAADGVDPLSDLHASADFRAHLARVNTRRALHQALDR